MTKEKIFCFPYAGGSSTLYEGYLQDLKNDYEMIAVDYSGHGTKFGLPLYETMDELVDDLYKEVTGRLKKDESYCFFGYSLGCIAAYEIACKLRTNGYLLPRQMFLCSMQAPHKVPTTQWFHQLSEEDFKNEMIKMGGLDEELLGDPFMLSVFMPIIRRDFQLHELYEDKGHEILETDALIMYSEDDISTNDIHNWDKVIKNTDYICFDGGHFFIYDKVKEVVSEVVKRKQK